MIMKKLAAIFLLLLSPVLALGQTYNSASQQLVTITGVIPTYAAAGSFTPATGVMFAICGSSSRLVVLRSLQLSGTATSASSIVVNLLKTSTQPSAGTAITGTSNDTQDPASTGSAQFYTATPTAGTAIGTLSAFTMGLPPPSGITGLQVPTFLQNPQGQKPIILRGVNQCVELQTSSAIPSGTSLQVSVGWTEEKSFPPYPAIGQ
jgi:hypothetical protein